MEGMISNILNDPDQMKKIMDMAGQIMGNAGGPTPSPPQGSETGGTPSLDNILASLGGASGGGTSPLSGLFSGAGSPLSGILGSAGVQNILQNAAHSFEGGNDKKQLIEALKPWLSESRRQKLDRAMVFAKVMRVAGATAFLKEGRK